MLKIIYLYIKLKFFIYLMYINKFYGLKIVIYSTAIISIVTTNIDIMSIIHKKIIKENWRYCFFRMKLYL